MGPANHQPHQARFLCRKLDRGDQSIRSSLRRHAFRLRRERLFGNFPRLSANRGWIKKANHQRRDERACTPDLIGCFHGFVGQSLIKSFRACDPGPLKPEKSPGLSLAPLSGTGIGSFLLLIGGRDFHSTHIQGSREHSPVDRLGEGNVLGPPAAAHAATQVTDSPQDFSPVNSLQRIHQASMQPNSALLKQLRFFNCRSTSPPLRPLRAVGFPRKALRR